MSENDEKAIPAHKLPFFVEAVGEDGVKQIEAEIAQRVDQAKEEGREQKEATPPQPETIVAPKSLDEDALVKALAPMVKGFEQIAQRFDNLDARLKELEKTDGERIAQKAANTPLAALEAQIEGLFSKEAQVDGRTSIAKSGPKQAPANQDGNGLFFQNWLIGQGGQNAS